MLTSKVKETNWGFIASPSFLFYPIFPKYFKIALVFEESLPKNSLLD
jgi:hypothetical protein